MNTSFEIFVLATLILNSVVLLMIFFIVDYTGDTIKRLKSIHNSVMKLRKQVLKHRHTHTIYGSPESHYIIGGKMKEFDMFIDKVKGTFNHDATDERKILWSKLESLLKTHYAHLKTTKGSINMTLTDYELEQIIEYVLGDKE